MATIDELYDEPEPVYEDLDAGPANLDCIEDNLWLGNLTSATDLKVIENKGINHILTVGSCPLPKKISDLSNIKTLFVKVADIPREDLLSSLDRTYDFIKDGVANGTVLVHCFLGISRSATIVIAYLMKKYRIKFKRAFQLVKSKRSFIDPNPGFKSQLQLYEIMNFMVDKLNVQYKMFRLYIAAGRIRMYKKLTKSCADVIKPDPSLITLEPDLTLYNCVKCRRIVATASNIIPHQLNQKCSWRIKSYSEQIYEEDLCDKAYFVEPVSWMSTVPFELKGTLYCPNENCKHMLGQYNWMPGGCACSCGSRVTPGFHLLSSQVEKVNSIQNV